MKKYTMWKMDETDWILEIEDDALGRILLDVAKEKDESLPIRRFAVGINTDLRMFKVKDADVEIISAFLLKFYSKK